MITDFNTFNENTSDDFFSYLYSVSPKELKELIDATKEIKQNKTWHPEYDAYAHIRLVVNRLHSTYNDINLDLAGLFHDLGKAGTTEWSTEKETWVAPGHEHVSCEMLEDQSNFVKEMGGDYDIIYYIVRYHMSIKYLDNFRLQNKVEVLNNKYVDYLMKFDSADFGGTDLNCKPIKDLSDIRKEIDEYLNVISENKEMSKKFNGNIIMGYYPHLKGKELGETLTRFKEYISNIKNVNFRVYVLNTKKDDILKDFDIFINQ